MKLKLRERLGFNPKNSMSAEDAAEINYQGSAILRMLSYVRPHIKTMIACLLLVLVLTVLELYKPVIIGDAIDDFITGEEALTLPVDERFSGVVRASIVYIVVLGLIFLCNHKQYVLIQTMGQNIIYTMREELFAHVETLTMRFFDTTPVGKIVTRLTNDPESINELYSTILVRLFRNCMKIIGLAVMMLYFNVKMALFSFSLLPLVFLLTLYFKRMAKEAYQMVTTRRTAVNTFLSEHLSGMRIIQIFRREKEKYQEFFKRSDDLFKASKKELYVNATFRPITYFISIAARAIIVAFGSIEFLRGRLSLGILFIFIQYIQTFFEPIMDLAEQLSTLQSAVASAEKIFTLLDVKPLVTDPEEPVVLPEIKGRIEFKHVWFAYVGEEYVLRDVSFTIEPGQRVAFVGATGAGKSSILNLIGRYYDIQKGEILLDGVDIRRLSREQIRSAIGQVQQDVFIFTGDIKSNIRLRNEDISDEAIVEAAKNVNADGFIRSLPRQYDEPVSERGSTFSAGQRQLLSFARTLAYDPKILVLDEATSNIDTETELLIQDALERLMAGRTSIIVAHRLSTIQHADKIIVMDKGRVRESGTHQELLAQNGIYKTLYELQLSEEERG